MDARLVLAGVLSCPQMKEVTKHLKNKNKAQAHLCKDKMSFVGLCDVLKEGGSVLKLLYAVTYVKDFEYITLERIIDNLVKIRFKWQAKIGNTEKAAFTTQFSLSRHDTAKHDTIIKVNISSGAFNFSENDVTLFQGWSEWKLVGCKDPYFLSSANTWYILFDFLINAYEVNIHTKSLKLYTDGDFTDFHLSTDDGSVAVHKTILIAHSDTFKAMLSGKWKETDKVEIKMPGTTVQTLQQLKDYMYLGTVPDDGLRPLLLIARYYLMEDLQNQCIRKLAEKVTPGELFSLIEFACEHQIPELPFALLHLTPDSVVNQAHQIKSRAVIENESDSNA